MLYVHPDIAQAAVVGVAHPELGEEVSAAVVLKSGATTTAEALPRLRQGPSGRLQVSSPHEADDRD